MPLNTFYDVKKILNTFINVGLILEIYLHTLDGKRRQINILILYLEFQRIVMSVYALFASIGEHIPFKKKEKIGEANSEGAVNLLHYRATVLIIIAFSLLVTSTELIAGMRSILF